MIVKPRIPEGGAIEDNDQMNMEEYSAIMKKRLHKEYLKFAGNVISKVNPLKNARVLEIGPGPGWAGIYLLKERPDLFLDGWEISEDMIRVARSNVNQEGLVDRVQYLQGAGEAMVTLEDDRYDMVISRDSLHHWDEPERVFKEIERVLKPKGKVYIHDSRRDLGLGAKFIVNVLGILFAGEMLKYWKSSIAASYTPTEIEEMLHQIQIVDWTVESDLMGLSIYKV